MKRTILLLVVIIIAIIIVGVQIVSLNNKDKRIELTEEYKKELNSNLSSLITTIDGFDALDLSQEGNIIDTDKAKYEFILLIMNQKFNDEDLIFVENGYFKEGYIEISKFQNYAKKFYKQEIDINNIKDCIYIQDNTIYVKVSVNGLAVDYAVKADYIVENKKENNRSLYIDLIGLANENVEYEEIEKYLADDFLDYDKSKVTYTLKITYVLNEETQENYILSIEKV